MISSSLSLPLSLSLWSRGQMLVHNYVVSARYLEEESCTDSFWVHVFFLFFVFFVLAVDSILTA